jgi:hypothetical protein
MPFTCYSYPADVPPGAPVRSGARSALSGPHRMRTGTACFRDPADAPRSMPFMCFSYPSAPPGMRQVPTGGTCFRY